jgi:hypothetical protein
MALSVKRFIHELNCPEPDNQILAMYHPSSATTLCNGGGTQTSIFANGTTLASVVAAGENANGSDGGVCEEGMDIVFLIDYTSSMAQEIESIKSGISGLISTINTQSNGNYRLGLVIYDEGYTSNSPTYGPSTYYQNLPSTQKINTASPDQADYYMFFTAVEKMNTVGNSTSFTNALNVLNEPNGSNGMLLGGTNQISWAEQSGRAIDEIVSNDFAGSFRSGVQKLIILITDADPAESLTFWQNTLTPTLDSNNVQLMVNTSLSNSASLVEYDYLTSNTAPQGALHDSLDFSTANWVLGLEQSIEDLCSETFTYNCESLAIGWYLENGTQIAQYWNGTSWSNSHSCQYTVTINIAELITGATLDSIEPGNQYYGDSNTFEITGAIGTSFTITHSLSPDPGYDSMNITDITRTSTSDTGNATITTYTDGGEGVPVQDTNLSSNEFKITGTIDGGAVHNLTLRGTTTLIRYTMSITVNSDDLTNTGVSPNGTLNLSGIGFNGTNTQVARNLIGEMGTTHSFAVNFTPNPSDYIYNVNGTNTTYNTGTTETALEDFALTQTSISCIDFVMPIGGGSATFDILGSILQPNYAFSLTASENITGLQLSSSSGMGSGPETFTGYTGSTHNFNIIGDVHPDYNDPDLGPPRITGPNAAQVSATENDENTSISGTVLMPSGGGSADVEMVGSSAARSFGFAVFITDDFTDTANYQGVTLNGAAGSTVTATIPLSNTIADTTYTINSISDNSIPLTVTNTGTTLNLSLVMPSGGGSATVDVSGSNTLNQYSYTVTFALPENHANYGWNGEPNSVRFHQVTVTGIAGSSHSIEAGKSIVAETNYELVNVAVSETSSATSNAGYDSDDGVTADGQSQMTGFTPRVDLVMPVGGGGTSIACSAISRELTYTFDVVVSTDSGNSGIIAHSCPGQSDPAGLSRTNNGNGSYTLTYTGQVGDSFLTVIPVRANNNTDYRAEIVNWSANPDYWISLSESNNYCGTDTDYLSGEFLIPSLDSRTGLTSDSGTLVINDTVSARTHTFTLTSTDVISNVSVASIDATQNYYGAVGSTHNWSSTYNVTSGYNFNITGVSKSGSNSSSVSVTDSSGTNIGGQITMPSGGGSATVTASGQSSENTYTFTVTFSESISNAAWRSTGTSIRTRQVTLAPGDDIEISEYIDASAGYQFGSVSVSDNSSALTGATIADGGIDSKLVSITITMPPDATSNQSGTVSVTGATHHPPRSLTVSYSESITGAYIASGSGAGTAVDSGTVYTGIPGTTGNVVRYILPESGYSSASISSLSDNSTYIYNLSSGSGAGAGQAWYYSYEIPPVNSTGTITINGSAEQNCTCNFLGIPSNPSTYGGSNGSITIQVSDACLPGYTWTLNGESNTPSQTRPLEFEYTGLSAGSYNVTLTDSNGCVWTTLFAIQNPTTTTSAATYYYYFANMCDTGNQRRLRSTSSYSLNSFVSTGSAYGSGSGTACLTSLAGGTSYDYTITGYTIGDADCDCGGFGDPYGPQDPEGPMP